MGKEANFKKLRDNLFKTWSEFTTSGLVQDSPTNVYNASIRANVQSFGVSITSALFFKSYNQDQLGGEVQSGDVEIVLKDGSITVTPNAIITVGSDKYDVITPTPVNKTTTIITRVHCRGRNNA